MRDPFLVRLFGVMLAAGLLSVLREARRQQREVELALQAGE